MKAFRKIAFVLDRVPFFGQFRVRFRGLPKGAKWTIRILVLISFVFFVQLVRETGHTLGLRPGQIRAEIANLEELKEFKAHVVEEWKDNMSEYELSEKEAELIELETKIQEKYDDIKSLETRPYPVVMYALYKFGYNFYRPFKAIGIRL